MPEHARTTVETAGIPDVVHGFAVEFSVGFYPRGARGSHRRAVYATLRPATPELARKLGWNGDTAIVGEAPLDAATGQDVHALPESVQERLCLEALKPAARMAREVAAA